MSILTAPTRPQYAAKPQQRADMICADACRVGEANTDSTLRLASAIGWMQGVVSGLCNELAEFAVPEPGPADQQEHVTVYLPGGTTALAVVDFGDDGAWLVGAVLVNGADVTQALSAATTSNVEWQVSRHLEQMRVAA